jgi:hypothetical protein
MSKRVCYNYSKNEHFIAQFTYERKEEDNDKRKIRNILRKSLMVKLKLTNNETQVMRVSSQKVMRWQS